MLKIGRWGMRSALGVYVWVALVALSSLCNSHLWAQGGVGTPVTSESTASDVISVSGDVPTPVKLTAAALAKLPRQEVRVKDRAGNETLYSGPTMADVLQAAGMKFDPTTMPLKGAVASYVLVEAKDAYKALFALAEIDPTSSNQTILLADSKDGQPLSSAEGPWRVIAPGDKRGARWVRQVTMITVHGG